MQAYWRHVSSIVSAAGLILVLCSPASSKGDCPPGGAQFDPEATKIIERMNDFLTRTKQFSLTVDLGYDIVQESGQKIEFGETRVLTVRRPDHMRADSTDRDGSQTGIIFDGTTISAFDMKDKVYAVAEESGSIDDVFAYVTKVLGMRLPMGTLLGGQIPQMLKT